MGGLTGFVAHHLDAGRSDVVHDLLAFLAEQMIEMNKDKQATTRHFWEDPEGVVDSATFQKLRKGKQGGTLYKQPGCRPFVEEGSGTRHTLEESLAWSEEAFKDFAKALAGSIAGMSKVLAVYRRYRQSYSDLVRRIRRTDRLIDRVVYQLYGLTEEEIAVVEGRIE